LATHALNAFLYNRKSNAGSCIFLFAVESLEDIEDAGQCVLGDANAVIGYADPDRRRLGRLRSN
jgi:hypothetical protein